MAFTIALLTRSKATLAILAGAVTSALLATALGYFALTHTVTLSVDGQPQTIRTLSATVGDVLDAEDISVGSHDVVVPAPDTAVNDGTLIAVRYGRPLDINVDGSTTRYWVTSTDVESALDMLGLRFGNASLSASRSASIGRDGMVLEVASTKHLRLKVGSRHVRKVNVAAITVTQALRKLGVKLGRHDEVKPGLGATLSKHDRVVVTRVKYVVKRFRHETVPAPVTKRYDRSMYTDQRVVVRSGKPGTRDVTYRLRYENGVPVRRKVIRFTMLTDPLAEILKLGTKQRPAVHYSGNTVWDELAQCESGGNWAINTGNGYYGGLQFNLSTWHAYGGTGYPNEHTRLEQISIAIKVRNAHGGYGAWPACASKLGLPT